MFKKIAMAATCLSLIGCMSSPKLPVNAQWYDHCAKWVWDEHVEDDPYHWLDLKIDKIKLVKTNMVEITYKDYLLGAMTAVVYCGQHETAGTMYSWDYEDIARFVDTGRDYSL